MQKQYKHSLFTPTPSVAVQITDTLSTHRYSSSSNIPVSWHGSPTESQAQHPWCHPKPHPHAGKDNYPHARIHELSTNDWKHLWNKHVPHLHFRFVIKKVYNVSV